MLKMPPLSDEISNVKTAQDCMNAAQNAELVAALDHTITNWCKEIEKVRTDAGFQLKSFTCIKFFIQAVPQQFTLINKL